MWKLAIAGIFGALLCGACGGDTGPQSGFVRGQEAPDKDQTGQVVVAEVDGGPDADFDFEPGTGAPLAPEEPRRKSLTPEPQVIGGFREIDQGPPCLPGSGQCQTCEDACSACLCIDPQAAECAVLCE